MRAGKLRHKVQFQKPVSGTSDYSDKVAKSWGNATNNPTSAELRPVSAKEVEAAAGKVVHTDLTVVIRYHKVLAQMNNHWRMTHKGITYEVLAAFDPEMRRRQLKIHIRKQTT